MNWVMMSSEEQDNNPKPKTFQPAKSKKVFDVVRPGKSPASPTSRPVITGHKPQVPDDQFVPGPNTRLAGNPSEERPLMDGGKKVGVTPLPDTTEHAVVPVPAESEDAGLPGQEEENVSASVAEQEPENNSAPELPESEAEEQAGEPLAELQADPGQAEDQHPNGPDEEKGEKPTPEQLAVGQVVDASGSPSEKSDDSQPPAAIAEDAKEPPMTQDDVLAETDAPMLEHAVVSHHKHHTKLWEWLLIFFLIVLLALVALNFLLDASVVTTELDIPHTDLLKD